jgi:hypothetical protein
MKTLIVTLTAACAVIATYFGVRYFTRKDLGFTPVRRYVRTIVENLFHSDIIAAHKASKAPEKTTERVASS